eukprot:XP_028346629.1 uncharacterized protein LOC114486453 [Physeter catodon]
MGGLETAVAVPRGERKQPCLRKRHVRCCWPAASLRDRGPLLEKQEARISRTRRANRRPPARLPPILSSFCPSPAACLSIYLSICPSELEAQASSFGANLLSSQPVVGEVTYLLHGAPWSHRDGHPRNTPGCPASSRAGSTAGPARPSECCHPGARDPCGNPQRGQPHATSRHEPGNTRRRGASVRSQPPGAPPRASLDLRPKGHRGGRTVPAGRGEGGSGRRGLRGRMSQPPPASTHCPSLPRGPVGLGVKGHHVAATQANVQPVVHALLTSWSPHSTGKCAPSGTPTHMRSHASTHVFSYTRTGVDTRAPIISLVTASPCAGHRSCTHPSPRL